MLWPTWNNDVYDNIMFLSKTTSTTNLDAEFVSAWFNKNMQEALYIITIYKPPKMGGGKKSIWETILKHMP